jgi:VWFA-related protein
MRRRSKGWILAVVLAGCGVAAQKPAPIERAYAATPEAWPQVGFDVTVMDKDDEPAKGISFEQLLVRDNGKTVTAGTLTETEEPESVCLLVDTSGSTYENRAAIAAELTELIQDLPPEDEVCAIAFSSEAYLDVRPTMDREPVKTWVSFLRASGGTALWDAIRGGAMELEKYGRYRSRAMILISDGGENASKCSETELMQALHAAGSPTIYAIANAGDAGSDKPEDKKHLAMLTSETGGLEFPISRHDDEKAAVQRLVRAMKGRYRLVYTAPDTALDGSTHRINVVLNKDLRKQKMNIVAARGYDAVGR